MLEKEMNGCVTSIGLLLPIPVANEADHPEHQSRALIKNSSFLWLPFGYELLLLHNALSSKLET